MEARREDGAIEPIGSMNGSEDWMVRSDRMNEWTDEGLDRRRGDQSFFAPAVIQSLSATTKPVGGAVPTLTVSSEMAVSSQAGMAG